MSKPNGVRGWFAALDQVLRGEATRPSALRRDGGVAIPGGGLAIVCLLLAMVVGACTGSYAISHAGGAGWLQVVASALKVPALFALTLAVTFPSLYVFNALVGSRLGIGSMLKLLVAALAVTLAVLASLGPIVAFFSVITVSYAFVKLLNVAAFGASGVLGLGFLLQTLHRLSLADEERARRAAAAPPADDARPEHSDDEERGALDRIDGQVLSGQVKTVFRCWVVLFGLVGAQMAWVLRPFLGHPGAPFAWFRARQSNFFEAVINAVVALFQG